MRLLTLFLLTSTVSAWAQSHSSPDVVLQGEIHSKQNHTYVEAPFIVPSGTHRISVAFQNLGKDQHTVLDLGIVDPLGFRGASGGNKDHFTISETDATASYLPGAIPHGQWKLLIAVPNVRQNVVSHWRAEVWFNSAVDDSSFTGVTLRAGPGWFRGDLHMHTAHSDGSCASQTGKSVPCPVFLTAESAARRGLDFIAITDHNTSSQYNELRELQPYFDKLLLVPGRELTTFYGHANAFGTTRFIDYRVGTSKVPDTNSMLREARELGAMVSINHPELPTGEICMGCGWTPPAPVDMGLVSAIEVINGGGRPATGFWEKQIALGYRLTTIGGSDNHHADWAPEKAASIGYPTTIVHAKSLSVSDILEGIRSGHVFIDVTGSRDRLLNIEAHVNSAPVEMGDEVELQSGQSLSLAIHISGCEGGQVQLFLDGSQSSDLPSLPVTTADQTLSAQWQADGKRHWIRAEIHDADGRLILFGNPIYINFEKSQPH